MKIPVLHQDGTPLMPCSAAKAKKLIKGGVAEGKWTKLGQFYIQMLVPTGKIVQDMCLGLDPGSKFDGMAITSEQQVQTTAMLELPTGIADKLTNRRQLRRGRRYKLRGRPRRFDNRKRPEGWMAPSQQAKVNFRLKIIEEFCKLYPVQDFVVEDVKFNHFKKRWGKHFSTVEIGKTELYRTLEKKGNLQLYEGWQTKETRDQLGLKKSSSKSKRTVESHAIDALAMCYRWLAIKDLRVPEFWIFRRPHLRRRSLHLQNFQKGGIRRTNGGTTALGISKNTLCFWKNKLYRTGGSTQGRLSLHDLSLEAQRMVREAKVEDLNLLYRQATFSERRSGNFSVP